METSRGPRPAALQAALVLGGFLVLAAIYLAAMRLSVGISEINDRSDADRRDSFYLLLHAALLLLAGVTGFGLGRWLSGLGLAYALLFLVLLSLVMIATQVGSHELACSAGRNDIVRHWTC